MVFVDSELLGDGLRRLLAITGQHDNLFDAEPMQQGDCLLRRRLRHIGHCNPADALAVERDEQHRPARLPAQLVGNRRAASRNHLPVPDDDGMPVDFRFDAMSSLLDDIGGDRFRVIPVFLALVCRDNRFRYRMGRHRFRRGREPQDVDTAIPAARIDFRHGERAARERSRLVHRDRIERGEPL